MPELIDFPQAIGVNGSYGLEYQYTNSGSCNHKFGNNMKGRILIICLVVSLLLNLIAIPFLLWSLLGYRMMYRENVDYVAELAYAVGYHKALGNNLATELESYPTRLQITKVNSNSVDAVIWPAKRQSIRLDFSDPKICNATIFVEPVGAANGGEPIRSDKNTTSSPADSRR